MPWWWPFGGERGVTRGSTEMNDETVGAGGLPSSVMSGDEAQPAAPSLAEAATPAPPEPTTAPQAAVATVPEIEPMPLVAEPEPALPPAIDLSDPGALPQPRDVAARVPGARARGGRGLAQPAARAREVPLDLQLQHGRVLHGARRGSQAAGRGGRARPVGRRADPRRAASARARARRVAARAKPARVSRRCATSCARRTSTSWTTTSSTTRSGGRRRVLREHVYPVLTPLAFDPARPFPHISNLSLNLAVLIRTPEGEERFARVKMPRALPRFVPVCAPRRAGRTASSSSERGPAEARAFHFLWLEQLVIAHLDTIFPGFEVVEAHAVPRDARRRGAHPGTRGRGPARDDRGGRAQAPVRQRRARDRDAVAAATSCATSSWRTSSSIPRTSSCSSRPSARATSWSSTRSTGPTSRTRRSARAAAQLLEDEERCDMFAAIRERDILLHRPFDSFEPFVRPAPAGRRATPTCSRSR